MVSKYKDKGWYGESERHRLARLGVKTRYYWTPKDRMFKMINTSKPTFPYKVSYARIDRTMISRLQEFLHKKFAVAQDKKPGLIGHPDVVNAQRDIENVTTWDKFNLWLKKHKGTILFMGLGGLAGIIGFTAGVPVLMQNTVTGEIVAVGGSLIGRTGMITQTILTGMGVIEELKVIDSDTFEKLFKEHLVRPEELEVETKEPSAFLIKVKPKETNYSRYDPSEYGDLTELSSKPIPWSKLDKDERKVLFRTIKKVNNLFKSMGKDADLNEVNLQIVKRVGPDDSAWGAHQGNLIHVDRDILKNPDKTEGIMIHENIHRVYGVRDETRDLENLQIDFMGKLL